MLAFALIAAPALLLSPMKAPLPALASVKAPLASPRVTAFTMQEAAGGALSADDIDTTCDVNNPEYCEPVPIENQPDFDRFRIARLTALFGLWYFLNVAYNIGNKLVLTAFPMPWTAATWELFFGFPYVFLLWTSGIRKAPKLSWKAIRLLAPSGFFLAGTHVGGVISFGAGAISFTHVIKATEPVWSALISAVFFREYLKWPVYATLIPIIGGVSLASITELSFTWMSFTAALLSAVASAAKAIISKKVMDRPEPLGENLTASNQFAVLSILGFLFILPVSLVLEGPGRAAAAWSAALAKGYTNAHMLKLLSVSGFLYYLYNEVAFLALSEVAPVTHAVTNTVKRVVIILVSVLFFRTPISPLGIIGSSLAILGATAYSLAKGKWK